MEPIFLDVEADLENKVYLLSYRIDDQTTTYVCDEALMGIALIFGLRTAEPEVACKELLALSANTGRPLACYSSLDATVLSKLCPGQMWHPGSGSLRLSVMHLETPSSAFVMSFQD